MAHRQSCQNAVEKENPNSAAAVSATLHAVTRPGPNRAVRRSLARLEVMVPRQMMTDTIPAQDSCAPSWGYMDGHAAPSRESGRPRLMKAR